MKIEREKPIGRIIDEKIPAWRYQACGLRQNSFAKACNGCRYMFKHAVQYNEMKLAPGLNHRREIGEGGHSMSQAVLVCSPLAESRSRCVDVETDHVNSPLG